MRNAFDQITFIIPTYNRPQFLIRLMRYFDSVPAMRAAHVVIADGSSDAQSAPFDAWLAEHPVGFDLTVARHPETALLERLGLVLDAIDTEFVILGADDDLYFFDWIDTAVAMMKAEPELGVVYGDFIRFNLGSYVPFGTKIAFDKPRFENPPPAWLEGDTAVNRLTELSRPELGIASTGWYALQRASLLKNQISYGRKYRLEALMFERFFMVAQAASAKTRMLPTLLGARQVDPHLNRPPFGFLGNAPRIEALTECCVEYFVAEAGLSKDVARRITDHVLRAELALMKRADYKRHLRKIANLFPFLRSIWHGVKRPPVRQLLRDERLPPTPSIGQFGAHQEIVRTAVRPAIER